jgi:MFS family permease
MAENHPRPAKPAGGISMLSAEIAVALVVLGLGMLVLYDSVRLGWRWGPEGPEAGYFPFYIGSLICIASLGILVQALFGKARKRGAVFVEWQAFRQVLSVLVPAALFVLGIQLIGLYVAATLYIAGFMLWLGGYGWVKSVSLGVVVSAIAFITFEVWFQVPLYKGAFDPLAFLGY